MQSSQRWRRRWPSRSVPWSWRPARRPWSRSAPWRRSSSSRRRRAAAHGRAIACKILGGFWPSEIMRRSMLQAQHDIISGRTLSKSIHSRRRSSLRRPTLARGGGLAKSKIMTDDRKTPIANLHPDGFAAAPGRARPGLSRLSRRGMGRTRMRLPRAVRKAAARRFPGGAVVDLHPAQARNFRPAFDGFDPQKIAAYDAPKSKA